MTTQALSEWPTELTCDLLLPFAPSSSMEDDSDAPPQQVNTPPEEPMPMQHHGQGTTATIANNKKRRTAASNSSSRSDDESSGTEKKSATQRKSRVRKPWYVLQKKEINSLMEEIASLQAQKESYLQSIPTRVMTLLKQQRENEELRHALQEQQLQLAKAWSALAGYSLTSRPPIEKYIHLGSNLADRVATFAELKQRVLHDGERYIEERLRCLDHTQQYSQMENYTSLDGDVCFSGFDVIPLEGFSSVEQVFDAMRTFYFNMEITWTETSNELMVREGDYESGDQDVVTQRFVRSTSSGAQIETNMVMFSMLRKGSGALNNNNSIGGSVGDSAVLTVDFVNQDELYPYNPRERMRQDITGALTLKAYPTKKKKKEKDAVAAGLADRNTSNGSVIMLTRAYWGRMHHSDLDLPSERYMEMVDFSSNFCFKTMLKTVGEIIESTPSS